ncbi:TetR/AcrR family transcriptional regulator [Shewanella chilikensis]|uniref:TetR/AcrR family transcriptional regulator n=1 Tax=Shewanella chilikensis TaxID=558541 RepID=UPI001F2B8FE5|nr:TetR/AcrR family transcriptional regulator [Shewanella chilikensis]MCE9851637.1 TetR/AcrR family transcriptional regulator [Shewanella chilikensis]
MDKVSQLLAGAFELFYRESVHGVGINQILAEAGIAKKTLYHHFEGKEALVVAVVRYRDQLFFDWLNQRLEVAQTPTELVHELFNALDDWFNSRVESLSQFRGCFFINTAAEYPSPEHPVNRLCREHKARVQNELEQKLSSWLGSERARELAGQLCLIKEGTIVSAQLVSRQYAAERGRKLALGLLD